VLLTLNQVISQITTLGAAHLQIQSTGVGDFAEWQALERAYPLLWVFHETTSIGDRELVYSIRLVCADRVITGEEGDDTAGMEQEVLSDTLLILLDFLAYFQQQHAQSYKVITSASIDPFTERFNDRVAGNSVLIQIRQPFTWDACQIPQTGATIPPSVDGLTLYDFCDPSVIARLTPSQVACLEAEYGVDATVTQNGNAFFTVPAGATYPLVTKLDGANSLGSFNAGTKTLSFTSNPSNLQINGAQSEIIPGNSTFNLLAKLDGVAGGVYNAGLDTLNFTTTPAILQRNAIQIKTLANASTFNLITKLDGAANNGTWDGVDTLDFTSAACSPVTFQINAVNKESLSSGTTFNLITKLDGAVNSGSYDAPTDTLSFTSAACSPVSLQINGTPQESIAAGATFNLIATLDGVAGGTYTPATDTLAFTSNSGWARPSDWIAIPDLTAADERFYGVVAVFENGYNQVSVAISNLAANINWGDGTSVVSNGGQQIKVYNYSTLSATIYQWPDGRNYKMALVDITRVGGAIASIDFWAVTTINSRGGNNFLDINCSLPNCSTLNLSLEAEAGQKAMLLCQRLRVWNRPAAHSASNLLRGMRSLRSLQYPYSTIGAAANFSLNSGQVDNVGNVSLGTSTQVNSMWQGSQLKKHGNLTANSLTNLFVNYCYDALQLTEFGSVTATSCTSLQNAWFGCVLMTKIGVINTPLCQSLDLAFYKCYTLEGVEFTNCVAVTNTNGFGLCVSLSWVIMPNLTRGISFSGTAMGNYGMNLFANSIGTASGAQTITITGTPFGALVTAADATALAIRAVMTGKGYTIAN
jgi:hypothetical protein